MKFCYLDESGTGSEPFSVMVGIIVDSHRMHITKSDWCWLLNELSGITHTEIKEIHTRDLYAGNGPWRNLKGDDRALIIDIIFNWLSERKHHFVYSAIDKKLFNENFNKEKESSDIKSLWRMMALHIVLSLQKKYQGEKGNKGNAILIFDNEKKEELRFTDLLMSPPEWTDSYYSKTKKQTSLDQIIDVPYFGDSKDVSLIQIADFVAYFLRRYIEIRENTNPPKYKNEEKKVTEWVKVMFDHSIGSNFIYPKKMRCDSAELFYKYAPKSIKVL